MSLDWELRKVNFSRKTTTAVPVLTSVAGYTFGHFAGSAAENFNEELDSVEETVQAVMQEYRLKEERIEAQIDKIPGLNWYKDLNEKLFGETQEMIGTSEEGFQKINPEDLSLQGLRLPDSYSGYPILGLAIGLGYGLMKVRSRLSRLNREKKILERLS